MVRVRPALSGDGIELSAHGQARIQVTVLKNHGSIAEYEINGSVHITFPVELSQGVGV